MVSSLFENTYFVLSSLIGFFSFCRSNNVNLCATKTSYMYTLDTSLFGCLPKPLLAYCFDFLHIIRSFSILWFLTQVYSVSYLSPFLHIVLASYAIFFSPTNLPYIPAKFVLWPVEHISAPPFTQFLAPPLIVDEAKPNSMWIG
jgi:hypothetical protein